MRDWETIKDEVKRDAFWRLVWSPIECDDFNHRLTCLHISREQANRWVGEALSELAAGNPVILAGITVLPKGTRLQ